MGRHNAGRLGSAWWRRGPLVSADANAVAHLVWRNGALTDVLGNTWAMAGTVPQVASAGSIPPGAGPYSVANNYTLGAGADVLDFAGGEWSAVVVAQMMALPASTGPLIVNATPNTAGWLIQMSGTGTANFVTYNGAGASVSTLNTVAAGVPFVVCCGRTSTAVESVKLNLGTIQNAGGAGFTSPTTDVAKIGLLTSLSRVFNGTIYEVYATTTAPSDALFTGIVNQVFSRLKRSP